MGVLDLALMWHERKSIAVTCNCLLRGSALLNLRELPTKHHFKHSSSELIPYWDLRQMGTKKKGVSRYTIGCVRCEDNTNEVVMYITRICSPILIVVRGS